MQIEFRYLSTYCNAGKKQSLPHLAGRQMGALGVFSKSLFENDGTGR
jgi:hypothetical protein